MDNNLKDIKLTIAVITMNRQAQLLEALESCVACDLPINTEFVVIDNASTDETEKVAVDYLESCGYEYYYEKMQENLGCGGGRNYAFEKSRGEYVYVLDDDAVISDQNKDFFKRALSYFEQDEKIVTLTTQIYDTAWQRNRLDSSGKKYRNELYLCSMFCGGSHFLKRSFFREPPYLPNKYGYEELMPSLYVYDDGKVNVFASDLLIVHNPLVNKWNFDEKKNQPLLINGFGVMYAVKQMMFPIVFSPIIKAIHNYRCFRHLRHFADWKSHMKKVVAETREIYKIKKRIKVKTVFKLVRKFGISIF